MMLKIKWKVEEAPTGQYRSFFKRGWPIAHLSDGHPAFSIRCEDSYAAKIAKSGDHKELTISVADWSEKSNTFVRKRLKRRAKTLEEAKAIAAMFLEQSPQFFEPKKD